MTPTTMAMPTRTTGLTPSICASLTPAGFPGARELAALSAKALEAKSAVASAAERNIFMVLSPLYLQAVSAGTGTVSSSLLLEVCANTHDAKSEFRPVPVARKVIHEHTPG
jgi:hypothetical protein